MWGVVTPEEAYAKVEEQKKAAGITEPQNLEEQAISLVGTDIYEKLVKGYTGLVRNMLSGCDIQLGVDYLERKEEFIGKKR